MSIKSHFQGQDIVFDPEERVWVFVETGTKVNGGIGQYTDISIDWGRGHAKDGH